MNVSNSNILCLSLQSVTHEVPYRPLILACLLVSLLSTCISHVHQQLTTIRASIQGQPTCRAPRTFLWILRPSPTLPSRRSIAHSLIYPRNIDGNCFMFKCGMDAFLRRLREL
ncbi:hypothetical protein DFH09DRAFT_1202240 [Mycena vulgaris]|nr:hypothetical protein DFH09DRAFT_1202240 [Mycena vulgaris]